MKKERVYFVPVEFMKYGVVEVVANSIEEALEKAYDEDLPENAEYLEDSFVVDEESSEFGYYEEQDVDVAQGKFENM